MTLQALSGGDPRQWFYRVPFGKLLGLERTHAAAGRAQLVLQAREDLGNVIGAVHGGAVVTLLDVAMASAAVSAHDFQVTAVTLNLDTAFLEPGRGRLTADAELLNQTDGVAWCRAAVTDEQGRMVARAQGSFRYLPLPKPQSPDQQTTE
jgi:uncharacterized protein (TIGR00369 family)